MRSLQVSCRKFAVWVQVDDDNKIVDAAPLVRRTFLGQPVANLVRWFSKFGGGRVVELNPPETSGTSNWRETDV